MVHGERQSKICTESEAKWFMKSKGQEMRCGAVMCWHVPVRAASTTRQEKGNRRKKKSSQAVKGDNFIAQQRSSLALGLIALCLLVARLVRVVVCGGR